MSAASGRTERDSTCDHRARDLLVTCGPGGVGKTTTAAALGVAAARSGRASVVVTVDPARRLADALGLEEGAAANDPHLVKGSRSGPSDGRSGR